MTLILSARARQRLLPCLALAALLLAAAPECRGASFWEQFSPPELHGFLETRAGCRTQPDPHGKDASVLETRLQVETSTNTDRVQFKYKGDVWLDGVAEETPYQTREAWVYLWPAEFLDIKAGRQVLTWGTGDLVFLNDLFPKDWQSFFIGRDDEYIKAPCDSVKAGVFTGLANLDVVYTPVFANDRFITGKYVSYWDGSARQAAGDETRMSFVRPERRTDNGEVAVRLYRNIAAYEAALYGYRGFWKGPGGQRPTGEPRFPRLNVYGGSLRGPAGPGIANLETAYYQSAEDSGGADPNTNNSEMRYLAGYAQELARDLTGSAQYYMEQIQHYTEYRRSLASGPPRDELRHVITLQVTQLLMNQNLELVLSGYYSPSDRDAYLRPKVSYTYTDHLSQDVGVNVFFGDQRHTMFSQYAKNTNLYTALRYSF